MKKNVLYLAIITAVMSISLSAAAQRCKDLPNNAQIFITNHFKGYTVNHYEKERDMLDVEHKVYLSNTRSTFKLEFDKNGNIKSAEAVGNNTSLPKSLVPLKISQYVAQKFPHASIVEWEKNRKTQEVKLNNGIELEFDRNMKLVKMDD